jgi:hypothetical protein
LRDHYDAETDQPDPLELDALLGGADDAITEKYMAWLQLTATNDIATNVSSERKKAVAIERFKLVRPTTWGDVILKEVPLQPDEEGYGDKEDVDTDAHNRHVGDPLGLVSTDLRDIQSVHIGNMEQTTGDNSNGAGDMDGDRVRSRSRSRGNSTAGGGQGTTQTKRSSAMKGNDLFNLMSKIRSGGTKARPAKSGNSSSTPEVTNEGTTTSASSSSPSSRGKSSAESGGDGGAAEGAMMTATMTTRAGAGAISVLPIDRSFRPALFLTLVHNKASLDDLQTGLSNLQVLLDQQSNMRENLVRLHLGHFMNCVDSIAWLKSYQFENPTEIGYEEQLGKRRERKKLVSGTSGEFKDTGPSVAAASVMSAPMGRMDGEKMASQAVLKLEVAKKKALDTLAPILNSMKRSRQIKATESILKRFANALDFPHLMQVALEKKDYEEVIRLNARIKAMPTSVNTNIRNNIKTKATQIVAQMRKALTADALRNYPFFSVEEVLGLFKNLVEIDSTSDYQTVLEKCFERQHDLFIARCASVGQACDEELVTAAPLEPPPSSPYRSPGGRHSSSAPSVSPGRPRHRGQDAAPAKMDSEQLHQLSGFAFLDSDDDREDGDASNDSGDGLGLDDALLRSRDETTLCSGIRMACFNKMAAVIKATFPVLSCMVTLLEMSSVVGGQPIEALLGTVNAVGVDASGGKQEMLPGVLSAPAALLKGMDVAYGRRHGGASKYANMLAAVLQKNGVVMKRLIEGFPDDVTSVAVVATSGAGSGPGASSTAAGTGATGSAPKRGLWSRIDDFEKVKTEYVDDLPPPPPAPAASSAASMLFAQGSGDAFGVGAISGVLDTQSKENANRQHAMNKCRELITEPFLSLSVRALSETLESLEGIICVSLPQGEELAHTHGMWITAAPALSQSTQQQQQQQQPCEKQMVYLPKGNPFYLAISSLRNVVQTGQEAIAAKMLKILEEAATRLMLSQEANLAIETAHLEGGGGADGEEQALMMAAVAGGDPFAEESESGEERGATAGNIDAPVYTASDLLHRSQDNYKQTYSLPKIKTVAATTIPPNLINPELTSFNDNNSRTSANDDNTLNKYGASLETKAYQFEYMIIYMLSSLHESLRRPELVSAYVESSVRVLFAQFITDLSAAECPALAAIGGYADTGGVNASGLFGSKRSAVSVDLELIELDLKVCTVSLDVTVSLLLPVSGH